MNYSYEYTNWCRIGDAVLNMNEVVGAVQDGECVEVTFRNGNTMQINCKLADLWGQVEKMCGKC